MESETPTIKIHVTSGNWDTQRAHAQILREEVFVSEQGVPIELEWDEMDALCLHVIAYDKAGSPIGTGRLLPDGHIGRMAVRKSSRGAGVGGVILEALMRHAKQRGDLVVMLNAQTHAVPFYGRFGFVCEGEEFMDAGIPHMAMRHPFP